MRIALLLTTILTLITMGLARIQSQSEPVTDQSQIAFISDRNGSPEIFLMNADGSMQTSITDLDSHIFNLAWSPNGQQLAFSADKDGKKADIYLMDVVCEDIIISCTSTPTNLTKTISDDAEPAWSSDGNKIAFRSGRDDLLWNIFIFDLYDSQLIQIDDNFNDFAPSWSPDGTQIAVQSLRSDNWDIYILNIDGSDPIRLTNNEALDYRPRWSPDGSKIAFDTLRDGNWEIYIRDLECDDSISGCMTNVTNNKAGDGGAAWSPDGSKIAFASDRDGNFEIYTANLDNDEVFRITNNDADDTEPAWRPFKQDSEPAK